MNNNKNGNFDYINSVPHNSIKIINIENYIKMLRSANELQNLSQKTSEKFKITFGINDKFNLGYISVELIELSILNPQDFINIIKNSDNFEIYPLSNGNIQIDITFQNVLFSIEGGVL